MNLAVRITDADATSLDLQTRSFTSRVLDTGELTRFATVARRRGFVLERDGLSLYCLGVAAKFVAPRGFAPPEVAQFVLQALAAITASDNGPSVAAPLVIGALPFLPEAPAELLLPHHAVLVRADAPALLVSINSDGEGADPFSDLAPDELSAPPDRFELISVHPHEAFVALVAEAIAEVRSGALDKVVLAREVEVRANRAFEPADLIGRLRALYPSCATFSLGDFVGASPELLCRRDGLLVSSHPLAGTVARSGDPAEDRRLAEGLLASAKEHSEHRIVVEAITADLAKLADEVEAADTPHLLELRNVVHLATAIEARFSGRVPGALEVALALHPTPAVGGSPKQAALSWIAEHEELARDRYAGPVGYMDVNGDGEWWLGIRCALLDGSRARLIAGVGIVADSDPAAELAETQLKLQALLAAAVRP